MSLLLAAGGAELVKRLRGQEIACALLADLLAAGPLKSAPGLSFLGQVVMDERSGRIHDAPPLH